MRKPIIIGNWKMNNTQTMTQQFINDFNNLCKQNNQITKYELAIAAPFTSLATLNTLEGIKFAAQNCHYAPSGAYTGEISIPMLQELNVKYVLVGHSERRIYFNETNALINQKINSLLANNLIPVLCCGETEVEFLEQRTEDVLITQLNEALLQIDIAKLSNLIIAYEPVWAIGTGKTASPEIANNICTFIRNYLTKKFGITISQTIRIQYGGSVKPENIATFLAYENIDGALVGGASLKAQDFLALLQ